MKSIRSKIDFSVCFMFAFVFLLIAIVIIVGLHNERNRINSGIIVDKEYNAPYAHFSWNESDGTFRYDQHYRPANCRFCIEGEKDGKLVRYWFDVPEEEYAQYQVGDFYTR